VNFKPLLSATLTDKELEKLTYPVLVSPKLDGLRCLIQNGQAVSRNLKPFRNKHVQEVLAGLPDGLDGELIVGSPNEGHVLNRTQSGIMSEDGQPDFTYWIFDNYAAKGAFFDRYDSLLDISHPHVKVVVHYGVSSLEDLLLNEKLFLEHNYEGLMVRGPSSKYKEGRATLNEQILGKLKRFRDGEAEIMSIEQGWHNMNEQTTDALGRAKRSNHMANKVGNGQVGTIIGRDLATEQIIQISPGRMTVDMRQHYWERPAELIGKIAKYKTFDYGTLDAPRFSTFQAFRDEADM
jgi:DNA ligase-1